MLEWVNGSYLLTLWFSLTLIGKSWKTHSEIFLIFSFSGSSDRPFYWTTHPIFFFEISILGRHTGRFTGKLINKKSWVPIQFFPNLPILLESSFIRFFDWNHIWYVTIGLDEFSSKKACVTPQNSPIDDWMSFPVKRSQKFPTNFPI